MLPRSVGESIAISIATYVPIEKILTSIETRRGYTHIYINVNTLIRNYLLSLKYEGYKFLELYKEFEQEFFLIKTLLEELHTSPIKPVFYIATHKTLKKQFSKAKLKTNLTEKQKNEKRLEEQFVNKLLSQVEEDTIMIYDVLIKGYKSKSLILTHLPIDLLSHTNFRQLTLIESNTGSIKTKNEWITKLTANTDYYHLPYNVLTLQILGDKSKTFSSMGNTYKELLLELAQKNKWNPNTTIEKIRFDIRKMKDRFSSEILLNMSLVTIA